MGISGSGKKDKYLREKMLPRQEFLESIYYGVKNPFREYRPPLQIKVVGQYK